MWLAASSFEVPHGLLATRAAAQLTPKPHQGLSSENPATHRALNDANSTVAIGLRAGLALNRLRQSERARYYGSALGRFTSPDQPLVDQYEDDPQSWNLYSYGRNNPLRNIDPTGNACIYSGSGNINDSSNYSDDNSGGQSCSEAFSPQQNSTPSATVNAQQGSLLAAVGTNAFLSFSNAANSYFSFIAPNSQLLSQTPNGSGTAANVGAGIGLAATLIGPAGEAEEAVGAGRLAHILRRHSAGSLAKNVSKFAKGLDDAAHIESMIESALSSPSSARGYADGAAYVDANLGVTIGTDPAGNPTTTIRVVLDNAGNVHSAFPVAQGHP